MKEAGESKVTYVVNTVERLLADGHLLPFTVALDLF